MVDDEKRNTHFGIHTQSFTVLGRMYRKVYACLVLRAASPQGHHFIEVQ